MPSNHLILLHPLLLPPSIFPSTRVFSNESVLHIRWPKYWSFSFNISPSNEYSGLSTTWQINGEKMETMTDFIFFVSKIIVDGGCSHEIKRHFILGRKAMTNLDSVFRNRDITFLTKVRIVKAMVFPVVMYGCESWTIKKTERWRTDIFKLWCWKRESPLDSKEIKPVNPKSLNTHWKDRCWNWSSNALVTCCEELTHWKRLQCWKDWRQKETGAAEDEMVSITNSMNMSLSKLQETVKDREAWHAVVQGTAKSRTWLSKWTATAAWRQRIYIFAPWVFPSSIYLFICL